MQLFVAVVIIVSILVPGCLEKWRPSVIGAIYRILSKIRVFLGRVGDVSGCVDGNKNNS